MSEAKTWTWIANAPTAAIRNLTPTGLAILYVIVGLIGALADKHVDHEVFNTIGLFIGAMLGVDVSSFAVKRFSDKDYAAAKTSPVTVQQAAPAPMTTTLESKVTTGADEVRG